MNAVAFLIVVLVSHASTISILGLLTITSLVPGEAGLLFYNKFHT